MGKKSKPQNAAVESGRPEFFPLIVGAHATLLGFTTLFLPRTSEMPFFEFLKPTVDEIRLTSRDRPQHSFLDALTLSPTATLAWICIGAVVLQSWWGGWLRARSKSEGPLGHAWLTTAAFSALLYIIVVLFGAPLLTHISQTALLTVLLAILVIFPPACIFGAPLEAEVAAAWVRVFTEFSPRTPVERAVLYSAVGTLVGAWMGAIPIALDWDRPWQAWPLTPAFGAILGHILASIGALIANGTDLSSTGKVKTS
ncbi:GPI biosynthesis protein family Pig-F-domain-containing protein [Roridomyces roridus]|uniref:GPI biosynthesis protein family Pig-F-domain-containing protein n=1 Tax=Roridomyces roridus TaxID=1738132 RepID=A0AAD7FVH1_9AGAR|nr:GPI biosynthesis protein family Pig-F-domain-containing protein [Roridomyces roridus]